MSGRMFPLGGSKPRRVRTWLFPSLNRFGSSALIPFETKKETGVASGLLVQLFQWLIPARPVELGPGRGH